jgi:membrane protease YdiL (CAAX protease family)
MNSSLKRPVLGVLAAIAVTAAMDAGGWSAFSALPLFPLMALFALLERFRPRRLGFAWGRWRHYGLAALYPAAVLGGLALASAAAGAVDLSRSDWGKAGLNWVLVSLSTILVAIVTEEGFFRGWLFASLERAGEGPGRILVGSSLAFSLWHVSSVLLGGEFALPGAQIPVYLVNAAVMGLVWGLLRWLSGSLIVASLSHGLWNGAAYVLFGFGTKIGALGIRNTVFFGAESGVLGLILNVVFAAALWRWAAQGEGSAAATRPAPGSLP